MTPERDAYIDVRAAEAECLRARAGWYRALRLAVLAVVWTPPALLAIAMGIWIALMLLGGGQ
jgi:hypothetical protein